MKVWICLCKDLALQPEKPKPAPVTPGTQGSLRFKGVLRGSASSIGDWSGANLVPCRDASTNCKRRNLLDCFRELVQPPQQAMNCRERQGRVGFENSQTLQLVAFEQIESGCSADAKVNALLASSGTQDSPVRILF